MIDPEKIIVERMIDAVGAHERQPHHRNSQVIQEHGVVGTASDSGVREIEIGHGLLFPELRLPRDFPFVVQRSAGRSRQRAADLDEQRRKRAHRVALKIFAGRRFVHIQVSYGLSSSIHPRTARPIPSNPSARIPRRPSCKKRECASCEFPAAAICRDCASSPASRPCRSKGPPRQRPRRRDDFRELPIRPELRCRGCALP